MHAKHSEIENIPSLVRFGAQIGTDHRKIAQKNLFFALQKNAKASFLPSRVKSD